MAGSTQICPKCERANGEKRATCIYCGEALPAGAVAAQTAAPKLIKKPGGAHSLVILLPAPGEGYTFARLDASAQTVLHQLFNADVFQLNQWFRARCLRVLKSVADAATAENLSAQLNGLGLRTVAIANQALSEIGYSFRAKKADLAAYEFEGPEKEKWKMIPEENFLLVQGKIKVAKNPLKEVGDKKDKKEGEGGPSLYHDTSDYWVFDLFSRRPEMPALRVKNSAFDFTCLGAETSPSSLINFNQMIERLKRKSPGMRVDDSFKFAGPVMTDEKTAGLFDPTVDSTRPGNSDYQNNERQFDQYARIICYLMKNGVEGFL